MMDMMLYQKFLENGNKRVLWDINDSDEFHKVYRIVSCICMAGNKDVEEVQAIIEGKELTFV